MIIEMKNNPTVGKILYELRDKKIQKDRYLFTKNLWLLGIVMGARVSEYLDTKIVEVESILGKTSQIVLKEEPVLVNVLRASNPMVQGNQEVFRKADVSVLAASRNKETLKSDLTCANLHYSGITNIENKEVLIIDPLLATAGTLSSVCSLLKKYNPKRIIIQCAIAAPEGIMRIQNEHSDIDIFVGAIDEKLNENKYIVPGLGDAGDLLCGEKINLKLRGEGNGLDSD